VNQGTGQGIRRARPAAAAAIVDTTADPVAGTRLRVPDRTSYGSFGQK
jgi:hypothetical protein